MSSEQGGPSVYDENAVPDVYDVAEKIVTKYKKLMANKILNSVTRDVTSLEEMGHIPVTPTEVEDFATYLQEMTDEIELQGFLYNDETEFSQGVLFGIYITASRIGSIEAMELMDDEDFDGELQ